MKAPGQPGILPAWTTSAKDIVGTALGGSRVWYTVGHGILNEVFWPTCSIPQIRDLGFIVAGEDFWVEVKRQPGYTIRTPEPDIPIARVHHKHPRYELLLEIITDPQRDVVLVNYRFKGDDLKLFVLLAPHLEGTGHDNNAWIGDDALLASRGNTALALMADCGWVRGSAGYVGRSDGWQDFRNNGAMTWTYQEAGPGNVALMGELGPAEEGNLALAFANTPEGARTLARSSLAAGYESIRNRYKSGWLRWSRPLKTESTTPTYSYAARRAAMVLKVHDDKTYPGAVVASLSTPWGSSRDDPGGYHLVWPRDAVEAGFAFLAANAYHEARNMLGYLIATQQADGHWLQNNFGDGRAFWSGIQLDETALPVLLAAKLHEMDQLGEMLESSRRMVHAALGFLARTGPFSPQDRWEENAGVNPFTLATTIAALVAGAEHGFIAPPEHDYALSLADNWNERLEGWVYAEATELDQQYGTKGHYVRITPPCETAERGRVIIHNRHATSLHTRDLLGMEFLGLVRFGIRKADDPRIRDTVTLIDQLLKVDTPNGPFYHRYNQDGYGEHDDGRPFDGTGIGRPWPLLSGERGHYAVDAGEDPLPFLDAMLKSASPGGMIPEQVWDTEPIPGHMLYPGRPTGSAMPLVWAHAEVLKLTLALKHGGPIERLSAVEKRYAESREPAPLHWRDDSPCTHLVGEGGRLLVEASEPFELHFGHDGWQQPSDRESRPLAFGMHGVLLDPKEAGASRSLEFTRRFESSRGWEGRDWQIFLGTDESNQ